MGEWYWITEYGKVFCGYLFLMFLWPSVVFRKHLRTKCKAYCFSFCVTAMVVIVNTVILLMGLFHILNQKAVFVIFYGIFTIAFLFNIFAYFDRKNREIIETKSSNFHVIYNRHKILIRIVLVYKRCCAYFKKAAGYLSFGYVRKLMTHDGEGERKIIKEYFRRLGRSAVLSLWRYGILALLLLFGMVYFSYGSFQLHSYGAGDLYTHHKWVYGLIEGNIFVDGIYPEAMHCFVYCMHTLFIIRVQSVFMYLQGIHVAVFLISIYLLLRKVFHWKYTPMFVLMLFLTLDIGCPTLLRCMYRLQFTLPQEFGLHTVCLSALYLMRYLNDSNGIEGQKKRAGFLWNENLFLFMASVAASATVHFFLVIMAFLVCFSVCLFALRKIFCVKRLVPLIAAVFCAALLSTAPLAGALLQGVPLSDSIGWAVNEMTDQKEDDLDDQEEGESHKLVLREINKHGYVYLYGEKRALCIVALMGISILLWILSKCKLKCLQGICYGYPIVILIANIYVFTVMAPETGLPNLIPEGRFGIIGHVMILAVLMMPIDVLFSLLMSICTELRFRLLSVFIVIGIYPGTMIAGCFRGFLYYELSRYNSVSELTSLITETFPEYTYTIVAPTDELYLVCQYGWHEELLTFVEKCNAEEAYSVPSKYVFIYVEKKPLHYAQNYFFEGPFWMGKKKYTAISKQLDTEGTSQAPEILASRISETALQKNLEYSTPWMAYLEPDNRTILESKAYDWCQRFQDVYPEVMDVFYEDDDFVCYYFRQAGDELLYNLSFNKR